MKTFWFHGGPKLTDLDSLTWDRERNVRDQNAAGPGMYWTRSEREAAGYGTHLYRATTKPGFRWMPQRPTREFAMQLFSQATEARKQQFLENWPDSNATAALSNYVHQDTMLDTAILLYHDLFQYNAEEYVVAIRMLFDGVRVAGQGNHSTSDPRGEHLVCWSPRKLVIDEASLYYRKTRRLELPDRSTRSNPADKKELQRLERKINREKQTGRYDVGFEAVCTCGHTKAEHLAGGGECIVHEQHFIHPGLKERDFCECDKFKKTRIKK